MGLLLVLLGMAGGAGLRYAIEKCAFQVWPGAPLPWAAFTVNVGGCFLFGLLLGRADAYGLPTAVYILLGGAITAFSIIGHEIVELVQSGLQGMAVLRALSGWLVGATAAVAGVVVS
ncbi:FluC/FEX family fluoride channel [Streptomyces sp. BA2]|uniref:FluC/FEX family fluoride channel n=1 Tax=Streptomyces sp. BA2 TaxID=436595 RepID=UPI0013260D8F|nr:CrcB family protein [Streptomyces sp. BA2]MWA07819.1 fluoride efflux transporter CrcB [Streptomyces sp. BA2]